MVFGNRCCCKNNDIETCCGERDIILALTGITLVDGPDAELSGCTPEVMAEMNAILASDIVVPFQGIFGSCQWVFSHNMLTIQINPSRIRIFYTVPFSGSPTIDRAGTWDCEEWVPSGDWTPAGGSGDNCFNWSGYETATETIVLA